MKRMLAAVCVSNLTLQCNVPGQGFDQMLEIPLSVGLTFHLPSRQAWQTCITHHDNRTSAINKNKTESG